MFLIPGRLVPGGFGSHLVAAERIDLRNPPDHAAQRAGGRPRVQDAAVTARHRPGPEVDDGGQGPGPGPRAQDVDVGAGREVGRTTDCGMDDGAG